MKKETREEIEKLKNNIPKNGLTIKSIAIRFPEEYYCESEYISFQKEIEKILK